MLEKYIETFKKYFTFLLLVVFLILSVNGFLGGVLPVPGRLIFGVSFSNSRKILLSPDYDAFRLMKMKDDVDRINGVFREKNIKAFAKVIETVDNRDSSSRKIPSKKKTTATINTSQNIAGEVTVATIDNENNTIQKIPDDEIAATNTKTFTTEVNERDDNLRKMSGDETTTARIDNKNNTLQKVPTKGTTTTDTEVFEPNNVSQNIASDKTTITATNTNPTDNFYKIGIIHRKDEDIKNVYALLGKIGVKSHRFEEKNEREFTINYEKSQLKEIDNKLLNETFNTLKKRLSNNNPGSFTLRKVGKDILVTITDDNEAEKIKASLLKPGRLTFQFLSEKNDEKVNDTLLSEKNDEKVDDTVMEVEENISGMKLFVEKKILLDGRFLEHSEATEYNGNPAVSFRLNSEGTKIFAKLTKENSGKALAIVLDGKLLTAPRINAEISDGSGVISGAFSKQDVNRLNSLLRGGYLETDLKILSETAIQPRFSKNFIELAIFVFIGLMFLLEIIVRLSKRMKIYGVYLLSLYLLTLGAMLGLTNTIIDIGGVGGIFLSSILALGHLVLLNINIIKEIKVLSEKSRKYALDNAILSTKTITNRVNIVGIMVFLILYNLKNALLANMAAVLLVGILADVFVFKFYLESISNNKRKSI
jgi:preprotein translocase subunit SecD